jgi:hypothetical protein
MSVLIKMMPTSNNVNQVIGDGCLASTVVFELEGRDHVIGILKKVEMSGSRNDIVRILTLVALSMALRLFRK